MQPFKQFLSYTLLFCIGLASFLVYTDAHAMTMALGSDFITGILWEIDLATGNVSQPLITGVTSLGGIEFDTSGILYGLETFPSRPSALYRIDITTGQTTFIGPLGLRDVYEGGLAWDYKTSTMYGVQSNVMKLFTVDLVSGEATIVSDQFIPDGDFSAISFDAHGDLYLLESTHNDLWQIDKITADVLNIIALSTDIDSAAGMDFDPITGTMYVVDGPLCCGPNHLYKLDVDTGYLTLMGTNDITERLTGLTIIPEPATLVFIGLGGLVLIRRRVHPH